MTPEETRQHVTEVEINATPDQVFRALTEAEQIVRWFAPEARVEPGPDGNMVGGTYYISWGPGADGTSKISIWEPGQRFAGFEERLRETDTLRRLVHSGFGRGAGWDNE